MDDIDVPVRDKTLLRIIRVRDMELPRRTTPSPINANPESNALHGVQSVAAVDQDELVILDDTSDGSIQAVTLDVLAERHEVGITKQGE